MFAEKAIRWKTRHVRPKVDLDWRLFVSSVEALTADFPYVDGPSLQGVSQCFDQIACVHMSGLFVRSHMNAGQDGFRDKSSKQNGDLIEGHWKMRNVSRRGSIGSHHLLIILQVPASAQHGCP